MYHCVRCGHRTPNSVDGNAVCEDCDIYRQAGQGEVRWGILVDVSLPTDKYRQYRWSSSIDNVPYEFESESAAKQIGDLAYGDHDQMCHIRQSRDSNGKFINEQRYEEFEL